MNSSISLVIVQFTVIPIRNDKVVITMYNINLLPIFSVGLTETENSEMGSN